MVSTLPAALTRHPGIWRGGRQARDMPALSTGHARLDTSLSGGGWPLGALTELLAERPGLGEFSLLMPSLAESTGKGDWVVLLDPPWIPYPPALRGHGVDLGRLLVVRTRSAQESLWACEQSLRGLHGGMVLAWLGEDKIDFAQLRRLQLAAHAGCKCAFVFRPAHTAGLASPAALRLHIQAGTRDLHVTILKCRGGAPGKLLRIRRRHPAPASLPASTPENRKLPHPSSQTGAGTRKAPSPRQTRQAGTGNC